MMMNKGPSEDGLPCPHAFRAEQELVRSCHCILPASSTCTVPVDPIALPEDPVSGMDRGNTFPQNVWMLDVGTASVDGGIDAARASRIVGTHPRREVDR